MTHSKDEYAQIGITGRSGNADILNKAAQILKESNEFDDVDWNNSAITLVDKNEGEFQDESLSNDETETSVDDEATEEETEEEDEVEETSDTDDSDDDLSVSTVN